MPCWLAVRPEQAGCESSLTCSGPAGLTRLAGGGIGRAAVADLTDSRLRRPGRALAGVPAQTSAVRRAERPARRATRDDAGRNGDGDGEGGRQRRRPETLEPRIRTGDQNPIVACRVGRPAMTVIARAAEREPVLLLVDDLTGWTRSRSRSAVRAAAAAADPVGLIIATSRRSSMPSPRASRRSLDGWRRWACVT